MSEDSLRKRFLEKYLRKNAKLTISNEDYVQIVITTVYNKNPFTSCQYELQLMKQFFYENCKILDYHKCKSETYRKTIVDNFTKKNDPYLDNDKEYASIIIKYQYIDFSSSTSTSIELLDWKKDPRFSSFTIIKRHIIPKLIDEIRKSDTQYHYLLYNVLLLMI
jgi:hypothetical protein